MTSGGFTYLACDPPADRLDALLDGVLRATGTHPDLGVLASPCGAEVARRGDLTFAFNTTPDPLVLSLRAPATDVLTGEDFDIAAPLKAGGVLVLREEAT